MSDTETYYVNTEHFKQFRTVRDISACKDGLDVLRCDIKDGDDAKLWVEEFSQITKTEWIVERSVIKPQRSEFCKWWCCQHASKNKKLENSIRGTNTSCKARLNVTIKKMTANVVLRDSFLQGPELLRGVVKIHAEHNHPTNSGDAVRMLRASRHIRLMFEDYFSRGLPPSSAKRLHESKLSMEENANKLLSDLSVNPLDRTVQYWYTSWRKLDYKKQVGSCEGGSSAKAALLWEASGFDGSEADFEHTWEQDEDFKEPTVEEVKDDDASATKELQSTNEKATAVEEAKENNSSPTSHLYFELTKPLNNSMPPSNVRPVSLPEDQPLTKSKICHNLDTLSYTTSSCSTDKLSKASCKVVSHCTTVSTPIIEKPSQKTLPIVPNYQLILNSNPVVDKPPPVFKTNSQAQLKCNDKNLQIPDTPLYQLIISQPSTADKSMQQVSKPLDSRPNKAAPSTLSLAGNNITFLKTTDSPSASNLEIKCLPPLILHTEKPAPRQNIKAPCFQTDIKLTPQNSSAIGLFPPPPPISTAKSAGLQNLLLVQFPSTVLPPTQPPLQKVQSPQSQLILLQSPVPPTPPAPPPVSKMPTQSQPRLILFQMPPAPMKPLARASKSTQPCGSKPLVKPLVTSNNTDPKLQQALPLPPLVSINRVGQQPGFSDLKTSQTTPLPVVTSSSIAQLPNPPIFQIQSGEQQQQPITSKLSQLSDPQSLDVERTILLPEMNPNSVILPPLEMLNLISSSPVVNATCLKGTQKISSNSINTSQANLESKTQPPITLACTVQSQRGADVVDRITSELVRIQKLCENPATFKKTAPRIIQCLTKIRTPVQAANALLRMKAALSISTRNCHRRSAVVRAVRSCRTAHRTWLAANRKHKDRRKRKPNS